MSKKVNITLPMFPDFKHLTCKFEFLRIPCASYKNVWSNVILLVRRLLWIEVIFQELWSHSCSRFDFFLPPVCTNIISHLRWALSTARSIFNRHYILGVASAPICRWHDKSTTVINLCGIPIDLLQPIRSSKTSRSTHSKNLVIYYYVSNATMSTKHITVNLSSPLNANHSLS
jgi:hypothetical protein